MNEKTQEILRKYRSPKQEPLVAATDTVAVSSTNEETAIVDKLNKNLLSNFKFHLAKSDQGYDYQDHRKCPPAKLNRQPLKTLDEALKFIGGSILRLYLKEAEQFRRK